MSATVTSVSCATPGNCAAIGTVYTDTSSTRTDTPYPIVLNETGGTWGAPEPVAGITSGAPIQGTATTDVSCAAPGECAAAWTYSASGYVHAYLIEESGGTWAQAQPVAPGTISNSLASISCPAPGDCTAVGEFSDGAGSGSPFVMDSSGGTWGAPQEVPGADGLSSPLPATADLTSVSCASAGNCVAGGIYHPNSTTGAVDEQAFLATETGGIWGKAQQVAGVAALDPGGWSSSARCPAPVPASAPRPASTRARRMVTMAGPPPSPAAPGPGAAVARTGRVDPDAPYRGVLRDGRVLCGRGPVYSRRWRLLQGLRGHLYRRGMGGAGRAGHYRPTK